MADEAKVLHQVETMLKEHDKCLVLRVTSVTGWADVIACINGVFVAIECKDDSTSSYSLSKAQRIRLSKVLDCNGCACVVDKNNVNYFKRDVIDNLCSAQRLWKDGFSHIYGWAR